MSRNVRVLACRPADVFAVLANGWLYPAWVVGAARMRAVDAAWPEPGSCLHHSFGVWPALIDDITRVEAWDPPYHAVLRARGWPVGEARVVIDVKTRGDGTVVRIQEEPVAGPGRWLNGVLTQAALRCRNIETLRRLAYLAEGSAERSDEVDSAYREGPSG